MKIPIAIILTGLIILFVARPFAAAERLEIEVKEHVLANGMKFLVLENHDAPVFSAIIRAKVGAVDEKPGQTGLSHFLEHMLFKGTRIFGTSNYEAEVDLMRQIDSLGELLHAEWHRIHNPANWPPDSAKYQALRQEIADIQEIQKQYVIKDELWEAYLKNGGTGLNASTGNDGTQFYVSLPANRLELWMLLEADRFRNIIFRELYSERDVVAQERRQSIDNSYRGKLIEQLAATAFTSHAYQHPVIGWSSDIENYDHQLLKEYYQTYYTPNNMIAVIAGDVSADEVFRLAEKYFGDWPRGPEPPRLITLEPPQKGERRIEVEFDANPMLSIVWHIPAAGHPDLPALDLLSDILSLGRTSRFNKTIVEQKQLASSVSASSAFARYPELFHVSGVPMKGHSTEELELAIYEEIEKLKNEPVSAWELEKVKNQFDKAMIQSVNSNMGMCWRLSSNEAVMGTWQYLNKYWTDIKQVTAEDIQRVARQYLVESNRTVATIVKPSDPDSPQASGASSDGRGRR